MSAGTITLTNNSAAVSGAGTAFTTDLKAGDFIVSVVGGVTYTLPVKTVNSATGVTLLKNYDGPTQAGAAWSAVPRDAMNAITAQLAAETAQALRGLNYDKQNWQQLFSSTGNITVRLPDGSAFTGPAWGGITTQLSNKADVKDIQKLEKDKMNVAILGTIGNGGLLSSANQTGVYLVSVSDTTTVADFPKNNNVPLYGYGFVIVNKNLDALNQLYMNHLGHIANRQSWKKETGYNAWNIVYGTVNTTVDSSGFIKRASPIVKIFGDGGSELNPESEGVKVNRESVGVYRISGVLGVNSDGAWGGIDGGFEIPTDRNGQRLLWLDYEVEADGSILVKTYHRTYPDAPAFARNIKEGYEEGDLIDIPSDQFVSVRVEMPQDSIWNLAQKAAQEEMEQEKTTEE